MQNPIIDFHAHPFRCRENCFNFYPEMDDLDAAGMRAQVERSGITHICGSVIRTGFQLEGFESLRSLNREALALSEILGGWYTPGFHIHPAFVRESIEEIEYMHSRGVFLIGELVPYMHGWGDFDAKNWMEIMDAADHYGMICSYHTPFAFDMKEMIAAHPGVTFVAAHPGDKERVPEHIALMRAHENVYLDLSGTGLFRFGVLRHLVTEVGDDRILFGTDYPICNPRMYVQAVLGEEISEESKRKILFENAEKLLKAHGGMGI